MLALKRVVTVAVMVYLLLALLFLLLPAVRTSVAELGSGVSPAENERNFFYVLSWVGVGVLALQLVIENLDSSTLRRTVGQQDGKINELKAKLYDAQQPTSRPVLADSPTPAVTYPTAASAAERDQTPPAGSSSATPTTF
jgi:hypothetical protein